MANSTEIEKKFLVFPSKLPKFKLGKFIKQAYIFTCDTKELRIRMVDERCMLSIKIKLSEEIREEYNYVIPKQEGEKLIEIGASNYPVEKIRYNTSYKNSDWEVDVFMGQNEGLIIAEIELKYLDQFYAKPSWVAEEVTYNKSYYNVSLYKNPYQNWK